MAAMTQQRREKNRPKAAKKRWSRWQESNTASPENETGALALSYIGVCATHYTNVSS